MADPNLTHSQFVAKLVAEGLLSIVQGKLPAEMPIKAVPMTPEEKMKAGANPEALAVFYPLGGSGVFMQMRGAQARIWYVGENCDTAVEELEKAIKRAFPTAGFTNQRVHPDGPHTHVRLYHVPISERRFITVEATYSVDRTVLQKFVVRLHARERT